MSSLAFPSAGGSKRVSYLFQLHIFVTLVVIFKILTPFSDLVKIGLCFQSSKEDRCACTSIYTHAVCTINLALCVSTVFEG